MGKCFIVVHHINWAVPRLDAYTAMPMQGYQIYFKLKRSSKHCHPTGLEPNEARIQKLSCEAFRPVRHVISISPLVATR